MIDALKQKPNINVKVILEEQDTLLSSEPVPPWNVCFVKGRGLLLQAQALRLELAGIPTYNNAYAIHVTNHRLLYSLLAQAAGVPEPEFAVGHEKDIPFEEYVIKEECVESVAKFIPIIGNRNLRGGGVNDKIYYFQRKINSEWEYKIYSFGENFFYYKEKPTLINPNKMATRVSIPENPLLREYVEKIKKITKLTITSIDFLEEDGQYYLIDVNSAPNFNYIQNGAEILADWLFSEIKR